MKKKIPILAFMFCVLSTAAIGSSKTKFSKISGGWLSDTVYTNDDLGIKFQIPDGWAADTDGVIPDGLDYHSSKEPTRTCIKVLVSYSIANSRDPHNKSTGSLFVLDPGCFPDAKFPRATERGQVRDFAGKMIHAFSKSPYMAPNGADVGCFQEENTIFVVLTGEDTVRFDTGVSHENMQVSLTEFNGYWIGWGSRADDERTEQLKGMTNGIKFWVGPKGKMP